MGRVGRVRVRRFLRLVAFVPLWTSGCALLLELPDGEPDGGSDSGGAPALAGRPGCSERCTGVGGDELRADGGQGGVLEGGAGSGADGGVGGEDARGGASAGGAESSAVGGTGGTVSSGGNESGGTGAGGAAATGGASVGGAGAGGGAAGGGAGTGGAGTGGAASCFDPCDCDGDGYRASGLTCGGNDCDDEDARVHPGQTQYFADRSANAHVGYDYNCNGTLERDPAQGATALSCLDLDLLNCAGKQGFQAPLPECGQPGKWSECRGVLAVCSAFELDSAVRMRCR